MSYCCVRGIKGKVGRRNEKERRGEIEDMMHVMKEAPVGTFSLGFHRHREEMHVQFGCEWGWRTRILFVWHLVNFHHCSIPPGVEPRVGVYVSWCIFRRIQRQSFNDRKHYSRPGGSAGNNWIFPSFSFNSMMTDGLEMKAWHFPARFHGEMRGFCEDSLLFLNEAHWHSLVDGELIWGEL